MRTPIRILLPLLLLGATPAWAADAPASPSSSPAPESPAAPGDSAAPAPASKPLPKAKATARREKEAEDAATAKERAIVEKAKAVATAAQAKALAEENQELARAAKRESAAADSLKDEVTYRFSRATARFAAGPVADAQREEIQLALDRAKSQVDAQMQRVTDALAAKDPGSLEHVTRVHAEVAALATIAHAAADQVEAVRTHDDDTEDTLQATSDQVDKIGDRAEEVADHLGEVRDELADRLGETEDAHGIGVLKSKDGVHVGMHTDNERVNFGGSVEVKKDEKVDSAVAFGGTVTIAGDVEGDTVAFGGNVHVTETGHVHGDAAAFGGRVIVDEGGRVDGEKTQVGAGKMAGALFSAPTRAVTGEGPIEVHEHSWPAWIGLGLLRAAAQFLCFFLLGMLVLLVAPKRVAVIADGLEHHVVKSGGVGLLLALAVIPICVILTITIVGIPLVPIFLLALGVASFVGYVALAIVVGRRLPTGVLPTSNAFLALGAAVLVVIGMIPILGWIVWGLLGIFALGAVILTRFGAEKNGNGGDAQGTSLAGPTDQAASA